MPDVKSYTLVLTEAQLNVVASGLSELPFKIAQPVIAEIQNQILQKTKEEDNSAAQTS